MIKTRIPAPIQKPSTDCSDEERLRITKDLLQWMAQIARTTPIDLDPYTVRSYADALSGMLDCLGWRSYALNVYARHSAYSFSGQDELHIQGMFELSEPKADYSPIDIVVTL